MTPQVQTVLNHLQNFGNLSTAEAATVYKIRSLPRRITDLKELGYNISVELKRDPTGQRYARYTLQSKPIVVGDRVKVTRVYFPELSGYSEGSEGTVTEIDGDGDLWVIFAGETVEETVFNEEVKVIG